jgi:hypothetical protein
MDFETNKWYEIWIGDKRGNGQIGKCINNSEMFATFIIGYESKEDEIVEIIHLIEKRIIRLSKEISPRIIKTVTKNNKDHYEKEY